MQEKALFLSNDSLSKYDRRVKRLLEFFGVPHEMQSTTDFQLPECRSAGINTSYRLVCAAQNLARVIEKLRDPSFSSGGFAQRFHSVFLYSDGDPVALAKIASELAGKRISSFPAVGNETEWHVVDEPDGICGTMSGLRVHPTPAALGSCEFLGTDGSFATPLVSAGDTTAFLKLTWQEVPFFISSAPPLGIDTELVTLNFDVRDHLFSALPVVCYLRWAFRHSSWNTPESSACLVLDDPLLRARYGFLRYRELLALMKELRFSTSIAFIPWNWRRSDPKVVQLFRDNPEYYSLCVHGSDHTSGEFAISDRLQLRAIAWEADNRMSLHQRRTGLEYDRVMVFPQGIFSKEAIPELKHAGFDAVVNTEVHSSPASEQKLTISDVWDVAVMAYSDFPIYGRRYPTDGIENFAFDQFLGKPCLVVIHHDFCRDGYARLVEFIRQMNAIKAPLLWHRLGDVVRRGYRQRQVSPGLVEIEMYGNKILVENRSERAMNYFVRRREREPQSIESLNAGARRLAWEAVDDHIEFKLELGPNESMLLTLGFKPIGEVVLGRKTLAHRARTRLRRYLSEARDNYLAPARARMVAFSRSW
jgi:hypothetical protein